MITWLMARLVAWLYDCSWPLHGDIRSPIIVLSFIEIAVAVLGIVMFCINELPAIIARRRFRAGVRGDAPSVPRPMNNHSTT